MSRFIRQAILAILLLITAVLSGEQIKIHANTIESQIFISEINYAGSTNDKNCKTASNAKISCANDKWIEIYNPTGNAVNLLGWKVGVGQLQEDKQKFASSFSITQDLIIESKRFLVLLNKNEGLLSTLQLAQKPYQTFGSLFGLSNNTVGSKYLRIALIKDGQTVSERNIQDLDELEKQNNIHQDQNKKYSIYYSSAESISQFSTEQSTYYTNNFATPGSFQIKTDNQDKKSTVAEYIAAPARTPVNLVNTKAGTELHAKIDTNTKVVSHLEAQTKTVNLDQSQQTETITEINMQKTNKSLEIKLEIPKIQVSLENLTNPNLIAFRQPNSRIRNIGFVQAKSIKAISLQSYTLYTVSILGLAFKFAYKHKNFQNINKTKYLDKKSLFTA